MHAIILVFETDTYLTNPKILQIHDLHKNYLNPCLSTCLCISCLISPTFSVPKTAEVANNYKKRACCFWHVTGCIIATGLNAVALKYLHASVWMNSHFQNVLRILTPTFYATYLLFLAEQRPTWLVLWDNSGWGGYTVFHLKPCQRALGLGAEIRRVRYKMKSDPVGYSSQIKYYDHLVYVLILVICNVQCLTIKNYSYNFVFIAKRITTPPYSRFRTHSIICIPSSLVKVVCF